MGNFENAIPKNIKVLERQMAERRWKIIDLQREFNHDCDCEYCTIEPEEPDEETEKQITELEAEIEDYKITINRLKRHAVANGIELEEKEKVAA
jgi:hypothetical protein